MIARRHNPGRSEWHVSKSSRRGPIHGRQRRLGPRNRSVITLGSTTLRCPSEADFFCLVALYLRGRFWLSVERSGVWWAPQILLFRKWRCDDFCRHAVRTGGLVAPRDRMFGFRIRSTGRGRSDVWGDSKQGRFVDFSHHLLSRRLAELCKFLTTSIVRRAIKGPQPTLKTRLTTVPKAYPGRLERSDDRCS